MEVLACAESLPDEVEGLVLITEAEVEECAGSDCEVEAVDGVEGGGVGLSECRECPEGDVGDNIESDWSPSS